MVAAEIVALEVAADNEKAEHDTLLRLLVLTALKMQKWRVGLELD